PEYMSPEQAKGEQLDGRSDVYALGCVMYAMLEGDAPFRGKKAIDIAMMHINNPFPQMSDKVPQQLKDIILKCVEKKPSARFQNVNELAIALEAFLDPIECRRRESGDAWTVRRSTPPGGEYMCTPDVSADKDVIQAKSVLAKASAEPEGKRYTPASQKGVRRVKSSQLAAERAAKHKPFNSQCIRLKTSPTLQSHSKLKTAEPPKREGFFKRCLDRIL
ncbi:MAG: protein kinase, partial [Proteobacteria bacterium]|nr:protein kinase [Pseudomonadota bacterium]